MKQKGRYFRETTWQQRRVLFETSESTGRVKLAGEKAHVSRQVFYDRKPRFDAEGYGGLEKSFSRAPHHPPKARADTVILLKKEHPESGKRRIADEFMKEKNWPPVISPNTVRGILQKHRRAPVSNPSPKRQEELGVRQKSQAPPSTVIGPLCRGGMRQTTSFLRVVVPLGSLSSRNRAGKEVNVTLLVASLNKPGGVMKTR